MPRISLHPGVYGTSAGLLITGGLAVISAPPEQTGILLLGQIAIMVGLGLLIWGLKINGGHWWKRLPKWPISRLFCGQMYIGQILTFDSQLDEKHTLSLTVRGYNGTMRNMLFIGSSGHVKLGYTLNGTGMHGFDLAPPGLVDPSAKFPPNSEFNFNFQQPLTPEQVSFFRKWESAGADITMMFENLDITVKAARFGKPRRLNLWDGINLKNGRFSGRIINVSAKASVGAFASTG